MIYNDISRHILAKTPPAHEGRIQKMCSSNGATLKVSYLHLAQKQPTLALQIIVGSRGKTLPHDNGGGGSCQPCRQRLPGRWTPTHLQSVDGKNGAHILAPQLLMNPVADSLRMLTSTSKAGRSGCVLSRTGKWMRLVRE